MMTMMERFERVLKDLDRCTQLAERGANLHTTLEEKLAAQRVIRVLREARASLRPQYYEFEDAVRPIPRKVEA